MLFMECFVVCGNVGCIVFARVSIGRSFSGSAVISL